MDNQPEDDGPMYVPARRSYEIVQYPASRRRSSFLVLFFVVFSALLAFWLFRHWVHAYQIRQAIQQVKKEFAPGGIVAMEHRTYAPAPVPLVGPYRLPLSTIYRLRGKVQSVRHDDYMATAGPGSYIMIPVKDCEFVNGGPYCKYHGTTVTRTSGLQ